MPDPSPERRTLADRRMKRRYRFVDRRSGFDRRRTYPVLGPLRDSSWLLGMMLVGLNLLSAVDWWFTMHEVNAGFAAEGNPVLGALVAGSPAAAGGFKFAVILLVSLLAWRGRGNRAILATALAGFLLYAWVVAYHVGGLTVAYALP